MGAFDLRFDVPHTLITFNSFLGGLGQARLGASAQQASLDQQANMAQQQAWAGAINQGFNALRPLALAPFIPQLSQLPAGQAMVAGNLLNLPGLTQYGGIQANTEADFVQQYGMKPADLQSMGQTSYQSAPPMVQEQMAGAFGYTPAQVADLSGADADSFYRGTGMGIVRQQRAQEQIANRTQAARQIELAQMQAQDNMARIVAITNGDAILTGNSGDRFAELQGKLQDVQAMDNITPQQRAGLTRQIQQDMADVVARAPANDFQVTKQATPQQQFESSLVQMKDPVTGKMGVYQPVRGARGGITKYEPLNKGGAGDSLTFATQQERDAHYEMTHRVGSDPVTGEPIYETLRNGDWYPAMPSGANKDATFNVQKAADEDFAWKMQGWKEAVKETGMFGTAPPEPKYEDSMNVALEQERKFNASRAATREANQRVQQSSQIIDFLKMQPPEELDKLFLPREFASLTRDHQARLVQAELLRFTQAMNRQNRQIGAQIQQQQSPAFRQGPPPTSMMPSAQPTRGVVQPPRPGQQQLAIPAVMNGAMIPRKSLQDGQLYDLTGMKGVPPGTVGTWDASTGEFVIPDANAR